MSFSDEEKVNLKTDIGIIKNAVLEMKPDVKKNTTFRLYTTGFFIVLIAVTGLAVSFDRLITSVKAVQKIERVIK